MLDMEKVYRYIEEHQEEYIALVRKFCMQPSIATMHPDIDQMKELVKEAVRTYAGIEPQEIATEGNPIIYGELPGENREKTLAFYNHYDVQPPEPLDEWKFDPYSATIEDGILYSRGAADNKDALACRLCAIDAIRKTHGTLPLNVKLVYEGEEEIGSPSMAGFVAANPDKIRADAYVWEGGDKVIGGPLEVTLGVKGLCYVELICRGAKSDAHSANAAVIENPAWRLVWALSTIKDADENILIEGFYDHVRPVTQADMDALDLFQEDENTLREKMGVSQYLKGLTGKEMYKKLYYEPTANICGLVSGYTAEGSKTVLPSKAVAKMDFRLVPDQTPEEIARLLREHLDRHGFQDIEMVLHSGQPPFRSSVNSDFAKAVIACAEEVYGLPANVYVTSAGTSPLDKICGKANIPVVMIGPGNPESQVHAPNEHIYLKDFVEGIKMTAAVMNKFSQVQ